MGRKEIWKKELKEIVNEIYKERNKLLDKDINSLKNSKKQYVRDFFKKSDGTYYEASEFPVVGYERIRQIFEERGYKYDSKLGGLIEINYIFLAKINYLLTINSLLYLNQVRIVEEVYSEPVTSEVESNQAVNAEQNKNTNKQYISNFQLQFLGKHTYCIAHLIKEVFDQPKYSIELGYDSITISVIRNSKKAASVENLIYLTEMYKCISQMGDKEIDFYEMRRRYKKIDNVTIK